MNTNDPATTYGKPILSDEEMYANIPQPQFGQNENGGFAMVMGHSKWPLMDPNEVRDFYENLIHEGRLRVVDDAGCGKYCKVCDDKLDRDNNFCPTCGSTIK